MKKIISIILVLVTAHSVKAQQLPLFSNYTFNSFIYNPAQTGLAFGSSLNLAARKQFTGLSNALGTYAATYQTRLSGQKAGLGLYVYNDDLNLFKTNSITGSYAYHVPLSKDRTMSFGLALSGVDSRYNPANFFLIHENDAVVNELGNNGGFTFDGNLGVNVDLGKLSLGLANLQILKSQEAFKNNANQKSLYTLANHWMFTMGLDLPLNESFEINPLVLYRKAPAAPGQVDVNVMLNWLDKGYAGIAYRDGLSFSTMLGINLRKNIIAGYAFDITTHKKRTALGNTHEVMLRFELGNSSKSNTNQNDVVASADVKKYTDKIASLETEVEDLKATTTRVIVDTFIMEKVVVKEVVKEVPVKSTTVKTTNPEPKTTTTPPKTTNPAPAAGEFYIIAGSFASQTAANRHIRTLSGRGYSSFSKYDPSSGRYYVHMGQYSDKQKAIDYIGSMKSTGLPLWIKSM